MKLFLLACTLISSFGITHSKADDSGVLSAIEQRKVFFQNRIKSMSAFAEDLKQSRNVNLHYDFYMIPNHDFQQRIHVNDSISLNESDQSNTLVTYTVRGTFRESGATLTTIEYSSHQETQVSVEALFEKTQKGESLTATEIASLHRKNLWITFESCSDQALLKLQDRNDLLALATLLLAKPSARLLLRGHLGFNTNSDYPVDKPLEELLKMSSSCGETSSYSTHADLMLARARTAKSLLVELGVDQSRIQIGVGSILKDPSNRRVSIEINETP